MKEIHICSWIITDDHKRVLLIKRGLLVKSNPNYWAFPSWKQDPNELLEETVVREVLEEVWLVFTINELYIETNLIVEPENTIKYFHRYTGVVIWEINIQSEECDWYWWFTYSEAKSLPMKQDMTDVIDKLFSDKYIK
jgi:8-oxo-dGTP pyrophosphatase MutT (NUDIX family)